MAMNFGLIISFNPGQFLAGMDKPGSSECPRANSSQLTLTSTLQLKNMNIKWPGIGVFIIQITGSAFGQSGLNIPSDTRLPRDSAVKIELLASLNNFLSQIPKQNKENTYVLNSDLLETSVLMDEMKNLETNTALKSENFYKPYLMNLARINDTIYLVQISYMGTNEGRALLRASFTLEGRKKEGRFYFSSPLKQNTVAWKTRKMGNVNLYFKNSLNDTNAKKYFQMVADYDKKLNAPVRPTDFYCADNFHEVLQLVGVDYKSDYSGFAHNTLTATENNHDLEVNGALGSVFASFDPHDLWHERLHRVLSVDIINRPVDEGTAYLYGGSWGLSWNEVLKRFKIYAAANPDADWVALYDQSKNFDEKSRFPLNVDFAINALLVQKIEKEKGFSSVIELLSCGKKQPGNENYFKALEKITGIDRANFNENVRDLIKGN